MAKYDIYGRRILDGSSDPNNPADLAKEQARLAAAKTAAPSFATRIGEAINRANKRLDVFGPDPQGQRMSAGLINTYGAPVRDLARGVQGLPATQADIVSPAPPVAAPAAAVPVRSLRHGGGYQPGPTAAPPPVTTGAGTGLTRIIKTTDANGNSVYTQASDATPLPTGGTARVYDALGERADTPTYVGAPTSVQDLARRQDQLADPSLVTQQRGIDSLARQESLVKQGTATAQKNPIYRELQSAGQQPIDPVALANLSLRSQELQDKQAQTAVENKRADTAAAGTRATAGAASLQRDQAQANGYIDLLSKVDKNGEPLADPKIILSSIAQRLKADPEGFQHFAQTNPLAGVLAPLANQTLRSVAKKKSSFFGRLTGTITADDAQKATFANIIPTADGGFQVLREGRTADITPEDLDIPPDLFKMLVIAAHPELATQ